MIAPTDVTALLTRACDGDRRAADELLPLVYDRLRSLAHDLLARERPDHTLQPTALVHEAYLKLVDQNRARLEDRTHFYSVAAQALRRILVDHVRNRGRAKRGGNRRRLELDERLVAAYEESVDVLALDEALDRLAQEDPERARIVELRFFGGLSVCETADALAMSQRTVERQWRYARAWLYRALHENMS